MDSESGLYPTSTQHTSLDTDDPESFLSLNEFHREPTEDSISIYKEPEQTEKESLTSSDYLYTWLQHPEVSPDEYDALEEHSKLLSQIPSDQGDIDFLSDDEEGPDGIVEEEDVGEEEEVEEEVKKEDEGVVKEQSKLYNISNRKGSVQIERKQRLYRPFYLKWCFGINIDGVLNLSTRKKTILFIAESHVGIIYDYTKKTMQHLEGHQHKICSIVCDGTGKWVATSDHGPTDTAIIVWDTEKLTAVRTIYDPFGPGKSAVRIALSPCGRYLVAVSDHVTPRVKFWLWSFGENEANDGMETSDAYGEPFKICFNPSTPENFFIAFRNKVVFAAWDPKAMLIEKLPTPAIMGLKHSGTLTDCTFIESCHHVVASSVNGCVLFFGNYLYCREYNKEEENNNKFFVKAVKISKTRINCITSVDSLIVTGEESGGIYFYDMMIRLLYWVSVLDFPAIHRIYFNLEQRLYKLENPYNFDNTHSQIDNPELIIQDSYYEDKSDEYETIFLGKVPLDATLQCKPFIVRNFIVVTKDGNVTVCDYIKKIKLPLFFKAEANVTSMDTHDECPYICIAYQNNRINLIDYETLEVVVTTTDIKKYTHGDPEERKLIPISYIKYSPKSLYLACGLNDGTLYLLDPILLTKKQTFYFAHSKIEKICWSLDHKHLAYYDSNHTSVLMKVNDHSEWEFCGKSRLHYKKICDMVFSDDEPTRLYTISDDRCIVQYDIANSGAGIIRTLDRERIEQSNVPNAIIFYPKSEYTTERYLFMADKQQKLKQVNEKTKICRSLVQGPTSGCYGRCPIYEMEILPKYNNKYMIFITDRHIGIHLLPACGNPYKYISCIGHPQKIKHFCTTFDKKIVFTFGTDDPCVLMWEINTPLIKIQGVPCNPKDINKGNACIAAFDYMFIMNSMAVEVMYRMGGEELSPFYCLIEGGAGGWLFKEIQDLFYYMQILHNGENSMLPRQISDRIPVKEIPDLMRAIGFYPTEYEIETILIDVKYREYDQTKKLKDSLTFTEFVILYINHRPAYGIGWNELKEHFLILCKLVEDDETAEHMRRSNFVDVICDIGELFTKCSANKCLSVLMHYKHEDSFNQDYFEYLPEWIDYDCFVNVILGVEADDIEENIRNHQKGKVGFLN